MSQVLDELEEIGAKLADGSATLDEADKFKYLSCQQLIIMLGVKGTKELMELDKVKMITTLDAMALLLFGEQWKFEPNLVAIQAETSEHT